MCSSVHSQMVETGVTSDTRENRILEYDLESRQLLGKRVISYQGLEASNTCVIDFYVDDDGNMLLRNYGDTFYLPKEDQPLRKISIPTHSEAYFTQSKIYLKGTAPHRLVGIRATRDTLNVMDTRDLCKNPHRLILGQRNLQALCASNNRVYCLTDSGSILIVSTVSGKILLKRMLFSQRVRGRLNPITHRTLSLDRRQLRLHRGDINKTRHLNNREQNRAAGHETQITRQDLVLSQRHLCL